MCLVNDRQYLPVEKVFESAWLSFDRTSFYMAQQCDNQTWDLDFCSPKVVSDCT